MKDSVFPDFCEEAVMSPESVTRVLVVDDDSDVAEFLTTCFAGAGCLVAAAASGEEALQAAAAFAPDVVFLDVIIPEQDGWLVCSKLKLHHSSPAIVVMTGKHEKHARRFADFVHADAFLAKPFAADDALRLLASLWESRESAINS